MPLNVSRSLSRDTALFDGWIDSIQLGTHEHDRLVKGLAGIVGFGGVRFCVAGLPAQSKGAGQLAGQQPGQWEKERFPT